MAEIQRIAGILPSEKKAGWETEEQRELLVELFRCPQVERHFFLSGGTALSAMYLGHRKSQDLDLFTFDEGADIPTTWKRVIERLRNTEWSLELTVACEESFASGVF